MTADLPPAPRPAGRVVDARLHLLDHQVHGSDGVPVTAVDDLDLTLEPGPQAGREPPRVTALLAGAVLGTRLFGGRPPRDRLQRIDAERVVHLGSALVLDVPAADTPVGWTERWVRDQIISRIPGGRHDPS